MRVGYYPGCSAHGTAREFDESVRAVAAGLGVELAEIDDWSCCGASSAHAVSRALGVALPARNLALAREQGHDAVLAPCAACYNRLAGARHALGHDAALAARVEAALGRPAAGARPVSIVELLRDRLPELRERRVRPLTGLAVACYYGCLLVRPPEVTGVDDPEQPSALEDIARACGAEPVAWNRALDCCGGGLSMPRKGSVLRLASAILEDARRHGARALVVACPMCHVNLDFRQREALARQAPAFRAPLPVLYLTQLVGLALGLPAEALGLARHFVDPRPLVAGA